MISELFNYLKESKWDKFKSFINKNPNENYNIYDKNYNYIIQYIINYNKIDLLKLVLNTSKSIKLDVLDSDGRTILYIPIKYNYIDILNLLLEQSKKIIGIPLIDIRDKNGYTALHYSIIFNNINAFKLLLKNNANPNTKDNSNNNCLLLSVKYKNITTLKILIENNIININSTNNNKETGLHFSINYKYDDISFYLINKGIELNKFENVNRIIPLHQAIILQSNKIAKLLIDKNSDINYQDIYGNSSLHYCIIEKNYVIFEYIINSKIPIEYNNTNINGDTILHLFIDNFDLSQEKNISILKKFVINTNINIQDNQGNTQLHLLIKKNIYLDEYKNKKLNIFIQNDKSENILQLSNQKDKLISFAAISYYNQLKKNKNWNLKWEVYCSKNNLKELEKLMKKKGTTEKLCIEKIKKTIETEQKSMPSLEYDELINFDHGIPVKFCSYTGSTIDVLFGLLFLKNKFSNVGFLIDSPLTQHPDLEKYYEKLGINIKYKLDFINFEIVWVFQNLHVPTYFDTEIKKLLDAKYEFIVIPIGIELSNGSHSNVLIWDVKNHKIERFEPNGKYNPKNLNYNPTKLDTILINRLSLFDEKLEILKPIDYLPIIGFQILEILETPHCENIGDPNGFCAVWSTWWTYQRLTYKNIESKKLVLKLMKHIKRMNFSFKSIIRNFSGYITNLRDKFLKDINIDINDWMNGNYSNKQLALLEKNIMNHFD